MIIGNVKASWGNKNFVVSILNALKELRADEFIQLYLQAQDPSVFKHRPDEGDAHTHLLYDIARNSRLCKIEKERGEIILQAIYAAPPVANTTKAMAMFMVGATLAYDDFKSRFGSGGDLEPTPLTDRQLGHWENLSTALYSGVGQSDDVRFLIDKVEAGEKFYENYEDSYGVTSRPLYTGGFNFNPETFSHFFESSRDTRKQKLLNFAPQGFFESDYFSKIVDSGFVPDFESRHSIIPALYKAGCVDTFEKLIPHLFVVSDAKVSGRDSDLSELYFGRAGTEITAAQAQIRDSYNEAFQAYSSKRIAADENTSLYAKYVTIRDALRGALIADSFDDFSRIMIEAADEHPVKIGEDIFDDLYGDVAKLAKNEIADRGMTKNLKAMLTLLKDTMVGRMNQAVDLVNQQPEVAREMSVKEKRGVGSQFQISPEPGYCR
jgi:hypothetical protein